MSLAQRLVPVERRNAILDAFERCVVLHGFHRTAMSDVAAAAGMSVGNLYRYFPSKDAIVAGMAERDREQMAGAFAGIGSSTDVFGLLASLGRQHFVEEPRERSIVMLEIWAEAARNTALRDMCLAMEREIESHLTALFERARATGELPDSSDPAEAARLLMMLADSLFKRKALDPDFDLERGHHEMLALVARVTGARAPDRVNGR